MNDETETAETTDPNQGSPTARFILFTLIPWIGGIAMVVSLAWGFVFPNSKTESTHCADAVGDATCTEGFGGTHEALETPERNEWMSMIPPVLGIGFFVVATAWIYGRAFIGNRARVQEMRSQAVRDGANQTNDSTAPSRRDPTEQSMVDVLKQQQTRRERRKPIFSIPVLVQLGAGLVFVVLMLAYAFTPWPAWLGPEPLTRPEWPIWVMVVVVFVLPNMVLAKAVKKEPDKHDTAG